MPPLVAPLALGHIDEHTLRHLNGQGARDRPTADLIAAAARQDDPESVAMVVTPLMLSVVWVASNRSGGGHLRSNRVGYFSEVSRLSRKRPHDVRLLVPAERPI